MFSGSGIPGSGISNPITRAFFEGRSSASTLLKDLFESPVYPKEGSGNSAKLSLWYIELQFSLSDGLVEKVANIGFLDLYGATGRICETGGRFVGESVVKTEGCGGENDGFTLPPSKARGGVLFGWRIDLSGDRPHCLGGGGLKTTSLLEE